MVQRRGIHILGRRGPARRYGLVLAAAALGAGPVQAAQLAEIRVGRHADFTRVVFELDAPAGYRREEPRARPEPSLRILLEAESAPRAIASSDPLVRSVRVKPSEGGVEVVMGLATAEVQVTEMILAGPPRIVFDLRRRAPQAKAAPAPRVSKPPAASPPPKEPETAGQAAEPGPREASIQKGEQPAAGTEAQPPTADRPLRPGAGAQVQAPLPDRPPRPGARAQPAPGAKPSRPPAAAPTRVAERKPSSAPRSGAAGRQDVADPLRSNARLILIAVGIVILALVWVWLRRRARAGQLEAAPFEEGEAGAELGEATGSGPEAMAVPEESAAAEERGEEPGPFADAAQVQRGRPVGEAATTRTPDERLAQLEARLADLLDARERIERQMAAHTEELRVQRSAIARTQRVVRAMARGETDGGEPLPRPADRPPE